MQHEARVLFQPLAYLGVTVRAIVVENQMKRFAARKLLVQSSEEPQKLLVSMARVALSDDSPLCHLKRSKESGRAVPLVIMSIRPASSRFER